MKKLLWKLGGGYAREKQQKLRNKLLWTIYTDNVNGWLKAYFNSRAPEVRA